MALKSIITGGFLVLIGSIFTFHVNSADVEVSDIEVSEGELLKTQWSALKRFSAKYPIKAAKKRKAGCATVEYVITPSYQIKNIVVTERSDRVFIKSSKKAVYQWKWKDLPKGLIKSPIKTRTRFDYCVESIDKSCDEVIKSFSCSGTDSISSIGSIVKRR